jgi:hypothetical protein
MLVRRTLRTYAAMAQKARKTEHAGPKKGTGSFYGRKDEAKHESNRRRRKDDRRVVEEGREGNRNNRGAV